MSDQPRHSFLIDDLEVSITIRAYAAYAAVLRIQSPTAASPDTRREADLTARLSSRVQRHSAGSCDCPLPPVLGGTPS